MSIHEMAGRPAPRDILVNVPRLMAAYYALKPDPAVREHRVSFGTSGHRGSSLSLSFNESHIVAISQAVHEERSRAGITGPLFLGMDTHALSEAAFVTAMEVLAANGVEIRIQSGRGYTPTPVISHAILAHNRGRAGGLADGVVITPSHNPPGDGGFKYNPPSGGPADAATTKRIESRANELLEGGLAGVRRVPFERALAAAATRETDLVVPYVRDLAQALDLTAIRGAGLRIGVDPMGGAGVGFWSPIAEIHGLDIEIVNPVVDPTFSFMSLDWDGKIRMDCSSKYAMASLIDLKERFDIAFGNDPDTDRHGIVTRSAGLMNPNHYLAVAADYLFRTRTGWSPEAALGKTLVSSAMIDRVAADLGRRLAEVPVGFKWFVEGLIGGAMGFAGEESAGASFLRMDGTVWTTDKDGILLDLLAAEITAVTGRDPEAHYRDVEARFGSPVYERIDAAATKEQKRALETVDPEQIDLDHLAGDPVTAKLSRAPWNGAPIGGIKVIAESGWFAARPSGTEDVYKIYAESFRDRAHLTRIQDQAKEIVSSLL